MSELLDDFSDDYNLEKTRHGCVTAWLWLGIIGSGLAVVIYLIPGGFVNSMLEESGAEPLSKWLIIFFSISSLVGLFSYYLMLNWKKSGFYIAVGLSLLSALTTYLYMYDLYSIIMAFLSPLILYAILQIQKDGVSAWNHLE